MSSLFKNIIRFLVLIFVQVFVLNQIPPLHHLVNPYIYFVFVLWLPFDIGRRMLMLLALFVGLTLDFFTKTPGLHAAACVFIAYIRPFIINLLIPQQGAENNYQEPSISSLGFAPYALYVTLLTFLHHAVLFFLEALQFGALWYVFGKTFLSLGISLVLILLTELMFVRKQSFRTNT
jgi:hypothetical protein